MLGVLGGQAATQPHCMMNGVSGRRWAMGGQAMPRSRRQVGGDGVGIQVNSAHSAGQLSGIIRFQRNASRRTG